MTLGHEQLVGRIVDRIVEILIKREGATYTLSFSALSVPLNASVLVQHANVVVEEVDANAILSIARGSTQHPEIQQLFHIISYGNRVTLIIHPSLCTMLPVKQLSALPFRWRTADGRMVHLHHQSVLAYADVCQLSNAILVTDRKTIITLMARDAMKKNQLLWSCSEGTSWN